jgi:hypothetical protein
LSAEERKVEVVFRFDKCSRITERSLIHNEDFEDAKFEMVELSPDEYGKMVAQLYKDIELCKKLREERIDNDRKE